MVTKVNKIIEENIDYVKKIAQNLSKTTGISSDELESYGYEGLIYAVRNYNEKKTPNMYNYMYKIISYYMLRGIPTIIGYVGNINSYWHYIKAMKELNIEDSIEINSDIANLIVEKMAQNNEKEINDSWKNCVLLNNVSSLEQKYNNSDISYLEKLSETIEEEYITNELRKLIFESLDVLTNIEKNVIIKKYNLDGAGIKTYGELAKENYTSITKIMTIEKIALKKLKNSDVSDKLASYMDFDMRINGQNSSAIVGRSIS